MANETPQLAGEKLVYYGVALSGCRLLAKSKAVNAYRLAVPIGATINDVLDCLMTALRMDGALSCSRRVYLQLEAIDLLSDLGELNSPWLPRSTADGLYYATFGVEDAHRAPS